MICELKGGFCLAARWFFLVYRFRGDDGEFSEYVIYEILALTL
jgi:hypothetical protein